MKSAGKWWSLAFALGCAVAGLVVGAATAQEQSDPASITIDATSVVGAISPMLYGQFDEFMFEGVKGGLSAELIRDRSFDGEPNGSGLPRYWERDPDDRNDDPALHFRWDPDVFYPQDTPPPTGAANHSLLMDVDADDGQ